MEEQKMNAYIQKIAESLTDEQKEKVKACKTVDEMMKFFGSEKIELPDEMLDAVSGGYIHHGNDGKWYVISDNCGAVMTKGEGSMEAKPFDSRSDAAEAAKNAGYSTEIITSEELKKLRDSFFNNSDSKAFF